MRPPGRTTRESARADRALAWKSSLEPRSRVPAQRVADGERRAPSKQGSMAKSMMDRGFGERSSAPDGGKHRASGKGSGVRPTGVTTRDLLFLLLGLLALLAVEVAVVHPRGEFPINDDWSYARIAKGWAETGHFRYVGWNQMMVVA